MVENTKIEWADHTFNPWIGCTKVSPGCAHCYAEHLMDHRFGRVIWGDLGTRDRSSPQEWAKPLRWNANAQKHGGSPRVFCASLADVFEDHPYVLDWRRDLFQLIEKCSHLVWMLLTKRPQNVRRMVPASWMESWPENVWMGTSVEDQQRADQRIPVLLDIPAKIRFLSIEPLLGPVDLSAFIGGEYATPIGSNPNYNFGIHWIIVGGESGPNARPMHPNWARSIRDQCQAAGVAFHFKQWGEWRTPVKGEEFNTAFGMAQKLPAFLVANDGLVHCFYGQDDARVPMVRTGKKRAGRILDGRTWDEVPEGVPANS